ncbi:hypothetical protein [Chlorogloea sp. CCALA 695]|uniref:hypothetical protein n=1 Tax=Chlorogloea sp. CCALA 695 TaxID=2107693 RepID=UPI000D0746B7|nr:hypothetical protein [Chlorogloea sp. CCALA 695]PSB27729.1 hypothetical protein C7B70_21790 [Chlorogloea sp. CCALA 695]
MTTSLAPHPLLISPALAKEIGLHEAVILQQVHYWLERSNHLINGCLWIYNTYQAWQEQFPFLSLSAIRRAIARLEGLNLLLTERFEQRRWNQTKWYSINYRRLEVLIFSICSNQDIRSAQIEHLDVAVLSSSSTEITAFTTSENTSLQSQEREEKKPTRNTVILKSCTSPVAKDELASKEQKNFALDLRSAPSDHIQNDFDGLPCKESPAAKSDLSNSVRPLANKQTNCLPQPAPANQPSQPNSDCTDQVAMRSPALESPARTQLLTRLSALTNESVDSLRLNTILNSALDRYRDRVNDALEYFQQAIATWKNKPGIGLFIHAVKSGQKPSLTKPGCGWKEWADEAIKRRLMQYSHSQDGDIMVHFVGGGQGLWSQLRGLSWAEVEGVAGGEVL